MNQANTPLLGLQIILIVMVAATSSCSKSPGAGEELVVAQGCTTQTPNLAQVEIPTILSMAKAGYGNSQCFVKGTKIALSITSVKVLKNKIGGGDVEVVFNTEGQKMFHQISVRNRGKSIVLMNKNGALATTILWNPQPKYGLLIGSPNMAEAKTIANAIVGK